MYKAIDAVRMKDRYPCLPKNVIAKLSEYNSSELKAMLADLERINITFAGMDLTVEDIDLIHQSESGDMEDSEYDEFDDEECEDVCDGCDKYDECFGFGNVADGEEDLGDEGHEDRGETEANASLLKALRELGVYEIGVGYKGENGFITLRSDKPISIEVTAPHKNTPQPNE